LDHSSLTSPEALITTTFTPLFVWGSGSKCFLIEQLVS
jgi:hypothetical protein